MANVLNWGLAEMAMKRAIPNLQHAAFDSLRAAGRWLLADT